MFPAWCMQTISHQRSLLIYSLKHQTPSFQRDREEERVLRFDSWGQQGKQDKTRTLVMAGITATTNNNQIMKFGVEEKETRFPSYPSSERSSRFSMTWLRLYGKTVMWLKERFSWRSVGQHTCGSKQSSGPTQFRDTLSMLNEGRLNSSAGSDCNWLPWRSSRVRLRKLWNI